MEKLDVVIGALGGCTRGRCRDGCPYDGDGYCKDRLMRDGEEWLKELKGCCEQQANMILDLTKNLRAARSERNALILEVEQLDRDRDVIWQTIRGVRKALTQAEDELAALTAERT